MISVDVGVCSRVGVVVGTAVFRSKEIELDKNTLKIINSEGEILGVSCVLLTFDSYFVLKFTVLTRVLRFYD